MPHKVTVLISGSGTNLAALLRAAGTPALPSAQIVRVISNRKAAYGLVRAADASVPTAVWTLAEFRKTCTAGDVRVAYDEKLAELVLADKPDLVVLAGFMHILSPSFLANVSQPPHNIPIINLHPALPHAFNGAGAIKRAYEAFQRGEITGTGLMCHYVIEEVDGGEPICVREIAIQEGESLEALEDRMHQIEWEIIVEGASKALQLTYPTAGANTQEHKAQ